MLVGVWGRIEGNISWGLCFFILLLLVKMYPYQQYISRRLHEIKQEGGIDPNEALKKAAAEVKLPF